MAQTTAWREHDRFAMLDALRGVLAVILFVAHTHDFFGAWARPASAITLDTYFVMAGFILAFVYEPRFAAGMTARAFIAIRLVRFFPIYLIGALLGLGVVFMASPAEALDGLAAVQLLMLPVPGDALYPWNIVAWAVLAELVVSIVYALTRRWLSMRVLVGAVAIMAVLLGAAAFVNGQIGMGAGWNTAAGGVARALFGFLAGLLLYRMAGAESHAQAPETRRTLLAFLVLLVPVVMAWTPASDAMRPVIDMAMAVGVNVVLIALAARFQPPVFIERMIAPLGTIAYALLLIHLPLYYLMVKLTYRWPWLYDIAPLSGLALFAVTITAAFIIDRWIDRPLRRAVLARIAGTAGNDTARRRVACLPAKVQPSRARQRHGDCFTLRKSVGERLLMSKTAASQRDGVFVMLDSIRGFGAIMVMIAHTYDYWGPWGRPASAIPVDLFFMLSGFVIAYVYERRFAAGMSVREFALHRIVRLYPLYLAGALLGFAVMILAVALGGTGGESAAALRARIMDAPLQLFMIPTPGDESLYPLNPPAWTLFFELLVNLLYVLIWRWLSTPRLIALVVVFATLLGITVFWHGNLGMGGDWATFVGGLTRSSFGFFMGVLLFRLSGSPERPSSKRSAGWTVGLLGLVILMTYLPSSPEVRPYLDMFFLLTGGSALIWFGSRFEPPRWVVAPLATLGRISFALYIIHIPVYFVMLKVTYKLPWLYSIKPWSGLLLLAVSLGVAYAIERWIDQPVRRLAMGKVKQWVKAGEWRRPKTGGWGPQMPTAQSSRRPPEAPPR